MEDLLNKLNWKIMNQGPSCDDITAAANMFSIQPSYTQWWLHYKYYYCNFTVNYRLITAVNVFILE